MFLSKAEWESQYSRDNYSAMMRLTNGVAHLTIATIPPKMLKVVNFLGYAGKEDHGWRDINKSAFQLPGMFSQLARFFMIFYWSYVEPHAFNNAKNLDNLHDVLGKELDQYPKVSMLQIILIGIVCE